MAKLGHDAAMTGNLVQGPYVYSLERTTLDSSSDNERIRQWVRSLTEHELGEDINFAPEHIYVAEHFHDESDYTQLDQWEVLLYPKSQLPEIVRTRKADPELRLFSVVKSMLDNGQELSTQTGFELSFAIAEDEEDAIYRRALAAANAWEQKASLGPAIS